MTTDIPVDRPKQVFDNKKAHNDTNENYLMYCYNSLKSYLANIKARQEAHMKIKSDTYSCVAAKAWCDIVKREYASLQSSNVNLGLSGINEKEYKNFYNYIRKTILTHFSTSSEPLKIQFNGNSLILFNAALLSGISTILIPNDICMEIFNSIGKSNKCVLIKQKGIEEPKIIFNK